MNNYLILRFMGIFRDFYILRVSYFTTFPKLQIRMKQSEK